MANNPEISADNTPYKKDDLNHFRQLLKKEEQETREEIENLQDSLDNIQTNQGDENSAAAHHQGDIASEEDEREKFMVMIEKEKTKMQQISDALDRIAGGTYGVCMQTGKKIQKERLKAIPYTPYSVEASKQNETA